MKLLVINCSPVRTGATAYIAELIGSELSGAFKVKSLCIGDHDFAFCKGCRSCHATAQCVLPDDGVRLIMDEFERTDVIVCVSPSYWADIPGQFKAFIDRCTPWCNTHEPHASLSRGKKGYAVALRTGHSMKECERIISSIEHFYGHLEIECSGHLGLCSVENRSDAEARAEEIKAFCKTVI